MQARCFLAQSGTDSAAYNNESPDTSCPVNTNAASQKLTSNGGRVTWVILRDVLLDFAHKVSAHISSLGVDSSTNTSKKSNGGSTQTVACDGLVQTMPVITKDLKDRCTAY